MTPTTPGPIAPHRGILVDRDEDDFAVFESGKQQKVLCQVCAGVHAGDQLLDGLTPYGIILRCQCHFCLDLDCR